uniref:Paf1 complex component isoform 1 n=1 Tax=Tetraselmis sp. GSL018 TaxID=582737 RepID=A0A061SGD3_9CHLO|mmetsp:Transcript_23542/g.56290  ORF Transcript_23542/g.56290 Transcript_23542/m.56290 type:complete len:160 (-) Transcript_23542:60-539(-)|eukprot:CAMPEP_0177583848 /NCGR_PEP_ID=MMETSP0419_2-20121207/3555_1 /TAXON_ID=582737 /ORGANISM="Tetraselmis sp., Strain GSL018" /LENGTH=159 /DNA_ID=CAMNT_0019073295 /DNA_START=342 /DNA_END=821 /DNA_ORIENTATION=-
MDPLQLLRDFTMRGELSSVTLSEKEVDFGDRYSFARSAITGYKSQKGTGQNYTLETVLFFLKNKNMQHTAYMKKARESKVSAVSFIDSQDLSNYLTGATDSSDYIDFASYERLGAAAGSHGQPPAKRPRPDGGAADDSLEAVPAPGSVEDSALQEVPRT